MNLYKKYKSIGVLLLCIVFASCKMLAPVENMETKPVHPTYSESKDSANSVAIKWKEFFADKTLVSLIDTALTNNIDLQKNLQEIAIARNEILTRKELL